MAFPILAASALLTKVVGAPKKDKGPGLLGKVVGKIFTKKDKATPIFKTPPALPSVSRSDYPLKGAANAVFPQAKTDEFSEQVKVQTGIEPGALFKKGFLGIGTGKAKFKKALKQQAFEKFTRSDEPEQVAGIKEDDNAPRWYKNPLVIGGGVIALLIVWKLLKNR
jgi:hypothetical protein